MALDRRNICHLKLLFLLVKVILFVNLPSIVLTCDNNGMVTLMQGDGDSPLEGRVEVCVGGLTGSVCGYSWDNLDASVVCKQLGFSCSGASAKQLAIEDSSTEDIVLFESKCEGNETILTGCSHSLMPQPCDTVAGVVCLEASCNSGDARLVDGSSPLEGRVEVCVDQGNYTQWGSVCSPLESITAAFIVCRQLHLADNSSVSVFSSQSSNFGPGTLPILLYNPRCKMSSRNLLDAGCTYNEIFGCHPDGVICPGTEHVSIVDAQPGISSIRLHWTLLNTMVSHYEVMCSTNKVPSLTYKTSVTVYGNTHNVIELEGLQPSSNYNCCVTAYRLQQDNGNQNFIISDHSCVSVDTLTSRYISPSQCQVTNVVSATMFENTSSSHTYHSSVRSTPTTVPSPQMACENFIFIVAGAVGGGVLCVILFLVILSCTCLICVRAGKKNKPEGPQSRFGENMFNNDTQFSLHPLTHTPTTPTSNEIETTFNHPDPPSEPFYAPLTDFPARTSPPNGHIPNHADDHTPDFEHNYDMPSCLSRVDFLPNGGIRRSNRPGSLEARNCRFDVASFDDVDTDSPRNIYHVLEGGPSTSTNGASATGNWSVQPPPVQRELKPSTQHSSYESTEDLFHFLVDPSHHNMTSTSDRTEEPPAQPVENHQLKVTENTEHLYHVIEQNMTSEVVEQRMPVSRGEQTQIETNKVIPKKPKLSRSEGTETEPVYHVLEQRENGNGSNTAVTTDRVATAVDTVTNLQYIVLEGTDSDTVRNPQYIALEGQDSDDV